MQWCKYIWINLLQIYQQYCKYIWVEISKIYQQLCIYILGEFDINICATVQTYLGNSFLNICALLGEIPLKYLCSGAGKTSLLRVLRGLWPGGQGVVAMVGGDQVGSIKESL